MLCVCFYLKLRISRFPIIATHTDKAEDTKKLKKIFFMYFIEGDNNLLSPFLIFKITTLKTI